MDIHYLDIQDRYFQDIKNEIKKFEIRRTNRDYKIGDLLYLKNIKTNEIIKKQITYINDLSIYDIKGILILGI